MAYIVKNPVREQGIRATPVMNVGVWTPSGAETWSGYVLDNICIAAMGEYDNAYQQWEAISRARQMGGFVPSFGLSYQTRHVGGGSPLRKEVEDTATLWKYFKIGDKWADGLFIQYPFPNEDGTDFVRDEKGVPKARQIWQMALPLKNLQVSVMPPELDMFLNSLYGTEDARLELPNEPLMFDPGLIAPGAERRPLRGSWSNPVNEERRFRFAPCEPAVRPNGTYFRVLKYGQCSIKDVDSRRGRLIVKARSAEEAELYGSALRNIGVPFAEE